MKHGKLSLGELEWELRDHILNGCINPTVSYTLDGSILSVSMDLSEYDGVQYLLGDYDESEGEIQ